MWLCLCCLQCSPRCGLFLIFWHGLQNAVAAVTKCEFPSSESKNHTSSSLNACVSSGNGNVGSPFAVFCVCTQRPLSGFTFTLSTVEIYATCSQAFSHTDPSPFIGVNLSFKSNPQCVGGIMQNSFKLFIYLYKLVTQKSHEYNNAALSESVCYIFCKIHLHYKQITISLNQMYRPLTYHDMDIYKSCISVSNLQYYHKMPFFWLSLFIKILVLQKSTRPSFRLLPLLCDSESWKLHNCKERQKGNHKKTVKIIVYKYIYIYINCRGSTWQNMQYWAKQRHWQSRFLGNEILFHTVNYMEMRCSCITRLKMDKNFSSGCA